MSSSTCTLFVSRLLFLLFVCVFMVILYVSISRPFLLPFLFVVLYNVVVWSISIVSLIRCSLVHVDIFVFHCFSFFLDYCFYLSCGYVYLPTELVLARFWVLYVLFAWCFCHVIFIAFSPLHHVPVVADLVFFFLSSLVLVSLLVPSSILITSLQLLSILVFTSFLTSYSHWCLVFFPISHVSSFYSTTFCSLCYMHYTQWWCCFTSTTA